MSESITSTTRWSIRSTIIAMAAGTTTLIVTIGLVAIWGNSSVAGQMRNLYEQRTVPMARLDVAGRALERQRANVLATIAAPNDLTIDALQKQINADASIIAVMQDAARGQSADPRQQALFAQLIQHLTTLQTGGLQVVLGYLQKGQNIEADAASQSVYLPQAAAATQALDALMRSQVELARSDYLAADDFVRLLSAAVVIAVALALVLALLLPAMIFRLIRRSLGAPESELVRVAAGIAAGRLDERIAVRRGDTTSVASSLDAMSQNFAALASDVASNAVWVAQAAGRLDEASNDLAVRTSEQAASLEECAASLEELASTVKQNSDNAHRARELAGDAAAIAGRGEAVMNEMASTTSSIHASSTKIADITGVIDGIAFQTNILALNAAVEAARAGEQGRGFAVVATEVRSLAQRSAAAAREIKALIGAAADQVDAGVRLASNAADTMDEIVAATLQVTEIVTDIAQASAEQLGGIEQVNHAVAQLEMVTQQNASLAEQTAPDARDMKIRADALVTAASRFSFGEAGNDALAEIAPARRSRSELDGAVLLNTRLIS